MTANKPPVTAAPASQVKKFGTFKGVFIPSTLTIFGVIMYLRMGWLVGSVGIVEAILAITLASGITFLTALSIAVTATNMKVGAGGTYYMISRSLGLEAGASIGVPLYLAQALGASFYVAGFAESVHYLLPEVPMVYISLVSLTLLCAISFLSADLALRTQTLIFTVILASLAVFFFGLVFSPPDFEGASQILTQRVSFWAALAIFFPAVTGIEAGLSLSGDLKNPSTALPMGTLSAVGFGYGVYVAIAIGLWLAVPSDVLLAEPFILKEIAVLDEVILAGLWGASLSSALGALLGAPRTLQALSQDGALPSWLGRAEGKQRLPRRATLASFAVAIAGVLLGDLDAIAPLLTMFFLTAYGFLNLIAGIEGIIDNPFWRPKFRISPGFSLAGAAACFATMFMIDAGFTFAAIAACSSVYLVLRHRKVQGGWSDIRHAIFTYLAKFSLYQLADSKADVRSWKPHVLVLSGSPASRWHLIEMADSMTHGKGLMTVATVIRRDSMGEGKVREIEKSVSDFLRKRGIPALVEVTVADDLMSGSRAMVRHYGLGPLIPNTIILGQTEKPENLQGYVGLLRHIYSSQRNLVIVRTSDDLAHTPPAKGRIDVWWGRQRQNAGLMLALAYMLATSKRWQGSNLHLKSVISREEERPGATETLRKLTSEGRIPAKISVLRREPSQDPLEVIRDSSADAGAVFLGMRAPEAEETTDSYLEYYRSLINRTEGLPRAGLVLASENVDFSKMFSPL